MGAFDKSLADANTARDLHPRWSKAYFRQGVALHAMALYPNAIAAFASGLPSEGAVMLKDEINHANA